MCLIIRKPRGRRIPADFLRQAWLRNGDGWGTVVQEGPPGGALRWHKGMCLGSLLSHNDALAQEAEVHLHLRKATVGAVTDAMAHPHVVRDDAQAPVLLLHNGTIAPLSPPVGSAVSDSAVLARHLGDLIDGLADADAARLLRSAALPRLLAPLIEGSMVVLVDRQGGVRLGRDWHVVQRGQWHAGMWGIEVSNTHTWLAPQDERAAA